MFEERWLRVAACVDRIAEVRDFVSGMAEQVGLDERAVYHCELSIDEAITNIIEHGYQGGDPNAVIEIGCAVEENDFVITVIDESPAFDPLEHIDPNPAQSLEERLPGGWGIFFIKKMMDDVNYTYSNGRNKLVMQKTVPGLTELAFEESSGIEKRRVAAGVWVVCPEGRLDSMTSPPFEAALQRQLEIGHTCLLVDMSRVNYISSSGLKALVSAWRQAKEIGGTMSIVEMQPRVLEVFDMVGFERIFNVFPTLEDAMAAINAGKLSPECPS